MTVKVSEGDFGKLLFIKHKLLEPDTVYGERISCLLPCESVPFFRAVAQALFLRSVVSCWGVCSACEVHSGDFALEY